MLILFSPPQTLPRSYPPPYPTNFMFSLPSSLLFLFPKKENKRRKPKEKTKKVTEKNDQNERKSSQTNKKDGVCP